MRMLLVDGPARGTTIETPTVTLVVETASAFDYLTGDPAAPVPEPKRAVYHARQVTLLDCVIWVGVSGGQMPAPRDLFDLLASDAAQLCREA